MSKKKPKKNKLKTYAGLALGLIILIAIVVILFNKVQETTNVAAVVNGEKIMYAEIDVIYEQLPETYKVLMTRNDILDQKIGEKLLLQKAAEEGITAAPEEVDNIIETIISQSGMTKEEFQITLQQDGISNDKLREYYEIQLIILKLLNDTAFKGITVLESEIEDYYAEEGLEETAEFEEAHDQIEQILLNQKREEAFLDYLDELKAESQIEIFLGRDTFKNSGKEVCREDGKPIIRMFTSSKCVECSELEEVFKVTVEQFDVAVYVWELDTGDNKITPAKETSVPKGEVALFKELNPSLKVPAFIFGCKYYRAGAGYDNLLEEQREFALVIEQLG